VGRERDWGIERKEGIAMLRTLEAYVGVLRGKCLALRTDNQWLEAYVKNEGGNGTEIQREMSRIVKEIYGWAVRNEVRIVDVQYIPSKLNVLADLMSRVEDHGNWRVALWVFEMAEKAWGPHTIDRMATDANRKLKRFNSWRFCPETEAVNAFSEHWGGENNWVAPPLSMVGLVVRHVVECRAMATLLVPNWISVWTPLLRSITVKSLQIEWEPARFCTPEDNGGREILKNEKWRLMLVRVDGRMGVIGGV
jgi:hypothetical protein